MFGVNDLITKINTVITSGTATEEQLRFLTVALDSLAKNEVVSVAAPANLPNPVLNRGRFIYVRSTRQYTFSNGVVWDLNKLLRDPIIPMWSWGYASLGRLGTNSTSPLLVSSPVSLVGGFTDWTQVSAGGTHSVAIRANGTSWAWGQGANGRLNNNSTANQSSPVQDWNGFTDWVQVSAGASHTTLLRSNGTAWTAGGNNYGQLGSGTTFGRSIASLVVGGITDWVQVSAGGYHNVALRANGTAWCWGRGDSGRLGENNVLARSSPVSVVGGFTDWVQVSAGAGATTAAIRANGTAWCWGASQFGILGDGTTVSKSSPVSVVGGFTDWVQISTGGNHIVAIRANGTAWGWGGNLSGRLGDNTITSRSSPVSVVGGFTDWVQISAGGAGGHTVAVRTNGTAWAWGYNVRGNLGDGTTTSRRSPVSVIGGFTDWVEIKAGDNHTHGLRAN